MLVQLEFYDYNYIAGVCLHACPFTLRTHECVCRHYNWSVLNHLVHVGI